MRLALEVARAVQTCQFGISSEVYQITVGDEATNQSMVSLCLGGVGALIWWGPFSGDGRPKWALDRGIGG